MASIISGQWMVSTFLKGLMVWGQSQAGYLVPLKQFSPVCLFSPPRGRLCRSTQFVFMDSEVYMVGNLFNWNFYIKFFKKKKKNTCQNRKDLCSRDLFSPNEFILLKFSFLCIFFQRCNSKITWKVPYVLLCHHFVVLHPIVIWVWVYAGGIDEERKSGGYSLPEASQQLCKRPVLGIACWWLLDVIQDQHGSTVGPFLLPVDAALWSFRKLKLNLKGSGELFLMNHKPQRSGEKAVSDAVIMPVCAHWYQLDYGHIPSGRPTWLRRQMNHGTCRGPCPEASDFSMRSGVQLPVCPVSSSAFSVTSSNALI